MKTPPTKASQKLKLQNNNPQQVSVGARSTSVPEATESTGQVVFLRAGSVWRMGPDGENLEQLTVRGLDAPDESPRLSPDGTQLAYTATKEGVRQIHLLSMEELIPTALTSGNDSQAAWSPDGTSIVFMRGDGRVKRDLYIAKVSGDTDATLIIDGDDDAPELVGQPIWTADGKSILFSADRRQSRGTKIWQVDIASRSLQPLTHASDKRPWLCDQSPNLSPDGKKIVFSSNRHTSSSDDAQDYDVYSMNLDGSGLTRLTDDLGSVSTPVYSGDGLRIYFASSRLQKSGFEWEIFVMSKSGGKQRRLSRDEQPENSAPFVAPIAR